jgi:hypothetical protein
MRQVFPLFLRVKIKKLLSSDQVYALGRKRILVEDS